MSHPLSSRVLIVVLLLVGVASAQGGLPDADGDGVPDVDDLCFGDDTLDADGDGIPDACDPCASPVPDTDCDRNGLDDACDLRGPARLLTFTAATFDPTTITLAPNGTAEVVDNRLQLIRSATLGVSGAMIEPLGPLPVDRFAVSFWFRATGDTSAFEGFTFGLYPTSLGPDHPLGSNSSGAQLHVDFGGVIGAAPNQITLRHTSAVVDTFFTPFPLNDGTWRRVDLQRLDGLTSMTLTEPGTPPLRVFEGAWTSLYTPLPMRFGFGAGALNSDVETVVWIDDVWIRDLSGRFDRDLDGDGVLDACQAPASQTARAGTPPNPGVLVFGDEVGPIMGEVYAPFVDHAAFAGDAVVDLLLVGFAPDNVPLAAGTLLVASPTPPNLVAVPAGEPFALDVPIDAQLLGASVVLQVASLGPDGTELTNAIDAVVGAWVPTK